MIAKIRDLGPEADAAQWVRFWDRYSIAIRQFAVMKGGAENADDIVMRVLAKLVRVLRSGQYTPEKGRFHSYLATMIVNEIRMDHRRDVARGLDRTFSIDAAVSEPAEAAFDPESVAVCDETVESIDEDWRKAVLKSAIDYVLAKTALSPLYRGVYRAYAIEGRDVGEVAKEFGISRNYVSQIKVRIDRRVVAVGRELARGEQ